MVRSHGGVRTATVTACDRLGEMPGEDAGTAPVLRVLTDLPAGADNGFYMEIVDPGPQPGDAVRFGIAAGPLGARHDVEWNGRRFRQRGYAFDWIGGAAAQPG